MLLDMQLMETFKGAAIKDTYIRYPIRMMEEIRQAIAEDRLLDYQKEFYARYDLTKNF